MITRANSRHGGNLFLIVACSLTSLLLPRASCAELQLGIRNEAFLEIDGDGLGGSFQANGSSVFTEVSAFKEHLAILLRSTGKLRQLEPNDIDAYEVDPDSFFRSAWSKRFELSDHVATTFVPERVRIDFSIAFNHSRGISQKGLRDSLGVVSDTRLWMNPHKQSGNTTSRRTQTLSTPCNDNLYTDQCKDKCSGYMLKYCNNCKCKEVYGGTPQCTCFLQTIVFVHTVLSNTFYAVLMFCCGLCARSMIIKMQPLETPWPNVGGQDFIDGPCNILGNMNVCCLTCCCPAVRMAMTYWLSGLGNYMTMLIVTCIFFAVPGFVGTTIFLALLIIVYRRKIRQKAKMRMDMCTDCCCACFCGYCLICQDARTVDKAWEEQQRQKAEDEAGKSESQLIGEAILVQAEKKNLENHNESNAKV